MTKFRFQVNGNIEGPELGDISQLLNKIPEVLHRLNSNYDTKLTGISMFEMIEKKDRGSRKRGL